MHIWQGFLVSGAALVHEPWGIHREGPSIAMEGKRKTHIWVLKTRGPRPNNRCSMVFRVDHGILSVLSDRHGTWGVNYYTLNDVKSSDPELNSLWSSLVFAQPWPTINIYIYIFVCNICVSLNPCDQSPEASRPEPGKTHRTTVNKILASWMIV